MPPVFRPSVLRPISVLFATLLIAQGLAAQSLVGRTLDASSGRGVGAVEIAVFAGEELVGLALSDSSGHFAIKLAGGGTISLTALAPGYDSLYVDSLEIPPTHEVAVELQLGPRPFEVEPIRVVAERLIAPIAVRNFYFRLDRYEKTGAGFVIDRETLSGEQGYDAARVLTRHVGVVRESTGSGIARLILKRKHASFRGVWCRPAFFLDGLPVDALTLGMLPASDLEGIEVYRGNLEVPAEFMNSGQATDCGVILAWTRRTF